MKAWAKTAIVIITLVIEIVLANILGFNAIKPDLMLIVVICLSFISGTESGVVFGFIGGLLKDIFSVHVMGINALAKIVIGYLSGVIREKIFYQHLLWLVVISTFIFTFVDHFILYFLLNALYENYDFVPTLKRVIFIQAIINSVVAPFVFLGITKLSTYLRRWS